MPIHTLAVDLGTSWAKVGVYSLADGSPRLLSSERVPSGAGAYTGTSADLAALATFTDAVLAALAVAADGASRLGLTGIREGLVLLDRDGVPLWVSGNALLDAEWMLDCGIGDIDLGRFLPDIVARNPAAHCLLTLQGYLAYRLTGRLALTGSELEALGLLRPENVGHAAIQRLLAPVERVAVGVPLGEATDHPGLAVYLAGTDEQASHHGAGLGATADLSLATATFWSLTAACEAPARVPETVRFIPAQPPYCASASVIGYRYGPLLQQALAGARPALSERLPRWAIGSLLDYLRTTRTPERERLLDCLQADLQGALGFLGRTTAWPHTPRVAVHGGGLHSLGDFVPTLMDRFGFDWHPVEGDATQLGCVLAGQE